MPSSTSSTPFSPDDGGTVVKTILSILFLGILCSMVHRVYFPNTSDLSKAEVNVGFGDSGDSITASATIRVEAPVGEQAVDAPDKAEQKNHTIPETITNIIPKSIKDAFPEFITNILPNKIPDVIPSIPTPVLPKCCQDWNPDCSWLEHMVEIICKFREDIWNMMMKALLLIRDIFKRLLSIVCDFLAFLLTIISSLIQYVDCKTSSNPWDGCSSKLLKDVLDMMDAKDKIVMSWIPDSSATSGLGLSMIEKILISFATMLGYLIIIVLCIFFDNSPQKDKIVQKIKGVFGNSPTGTFSDYLRDSESDDKEEDKPKKQTTKKKMKAVRATPKKKNKSKSKKKKSQQMPKADDSIAKIGVDINIEG